MTTLLHTPTPTAEPSADLLGEGLFDLTLEWPMELLAEEFAENGDWPAPLPEMEWCEDCAREDEPFEPVLSPGGPSLVVSRSVETWELPAADWDPAWGPAPVYDVTVLDCGHQIATPA